MIALFLVVIQAYGGGFVDEEKIPDNARNFLVSNRISMVPLDLGVTGSVSNIKSVSQFQLSSGEVFDSAKILIPAVDGYLESFTPDRPQIQLKVSLSSRNKFEPDLINQKNISTNKLILCVGVVQLIELLFKSKLVHEGDRISFSEFNCQFKLSRSCLKKDNSDACKIQYTLGRAILHALGIRSYPKALRVFDKAPLYVNQEFSNKKSTFTLEIRDQTLVDVSMANVNAKVAFGRSIHYCDMRINGTDINEFLSAINPNIIGLGMAFVSQARSGPISNDILIDAYRKLT